MGGELGFGRGRRAKSLIVQSVEILAHNAGRIVRVDLAGRPVVWITGVPLLDVGADQADIDGEALTSNKPFLHAACHGFLEDRAPQIALSEATMSVL